MTNSHAESALPRHPISVVSQRTGLSPDVLRVWERRYAVVTPGRGGGGQRLYSDDDVTRLRLLRDATLAGRSIGQVAPLATAEVARLVEEDSTARGSGQEAGAPRELRELVEAIVLIAAELDAARLDGSLRRAAARLGLPLFLEAVAVPALRRIGEEWHAGRLSPAHEHLASSTFHDIVADVLRSSVPDGAGPKVVVATPAGERHVNGALAVAALAAVNGWNVIYLGADLPAADIAKAADDTGARLVALSVTHVEDRRRVAAELRAVRDQVPAGIAVWAGGSGAVSLGRELASAGVDVAESSGEFPALLRRLAEK